MRLMSDPNVVESLLGGNSGYPGGLLHSPRANIEVRKRPAGHPRAVPAAAGDPAILEDLEAAAGYCRPILHRDCGAAALALVLDRGFTVTGRFELPNRAGKGGWATPLRLVSRACFNRGTCLLTARKAMSDPAGTDLAEILAVEELRKGALQHVMPLVDHLVVGPQTVFSFRESGLLIAP